MLLEEESPHIFKLLFSITAARNSTAPVKPCDFQCPRHLDCRHGGGMHNAWDMAQQGNPINRANQKSTPFAVNVQGSTSTHGQRMNLGCLLGYPP